MDTLKLGAEIDVQVDWLYKGKRKSKLPKPNTSTNITDHPNASANADASTHTRGRNRSTSVSNAVLSSNSSNPSRPSSKSSAPSEPSSPLPQPSSTSTSKKPSRSSSISASHTSNNTSFSLLKTKNTSTNAPTTANTKIKRAHSISSGDKPKKNIFTAIFGSGSKKSSAPSSSSSSSSSPAPSTHLNVQTSTSRRASISDQKFPVIPENTATSPVLATSPIRHNSSSSSSPFLPARSHSNSIDTELAVEFDEQEEINDEALGKLANISLKRVTFAVNDFKNDPPQQLPSRKPRKGNVLIPEDMVSETPSISVGISNAAAPPLPSSSPNASTAPTQQHAITRDSKEYKLALQVQKKALIEAEKHQQEAHYAAQRMANEVANYKTTQSSKKSSVQQTTVQQPIPEELEDSSTFNPNKIHEIDNVIHHQEDEFFDSQSQTSADGNENEEVTLDVVYTRCCHLREILPIPSTLKQVKGKTAPLQTLKFLNPKPTLIDVLSFCDFISIVPINTIIFDNVTLTPVMFQILIRSLANSTVLEKLGLRNVFIDNECWKLFCTFLLNNKSIIRLDLSQTKIKSDSPTNFYRHLLDWNLFGRVLEERNSRANKNNWKTSTLEELLLNGIKFRNVNSTVFENLITTFAETSNNSKLLKLGVASSELTSAQIKTLMIWMSQYKVQGVDLSFNDLSDLIKSIVSKLSSLPYENLIYFTLNNTTIQRAYDIALILKYLSKLPNLKFLDLSNISQVFPEVLPFLHKYLPRFQSLKRIHFDNNNLGFKEISVISSILVKCPKLSHISLMMPKTHKDSTTKTSVSKTLTNTSSIPSTVSSEVPVTKVPDTSIQAYFGSIWTLANESPYLVSLDIDYSEMPDEIQSRIAICLLRNMEKTMDSEFQVDELASQDDLVFDGTLMTETAESVVENWLSKPASEREKMDLTKKYMCKKYFQKMARTYDNVQQAIDNLLERQNIQQLSIKEKENLLRLLLVEKNLANIQEMFYSIPDFQDFSGFKPSSTASSIKHFDVESQHASLDDNEKNETTTSPVASTMPARPHLMATDSGRIIDVYTGQPLSLRKELSSTSLVGKKQEEEEGELHKWGFYVQQQRSLYPDNEQAETNSKPLPNASSTSATSSEPKLHSVQIPINIPKGSQPTTPTTLNKQNSLSELSSSTPSSSVSSVFTSTTNPYPSSAAAQRTFPKIPSGDEVRQAVIKARGIQAIEDLINKVSSKDVDLGCIYGTNFSGNNSPTANPTSPAPHSSTLTPSEINDAQKDTTNIISTTLPDSEHCDNNCKIVHAKYDEVINNLSVERQQKT